MPLPPGRLNADGSYKPYSPAEIAALKLKPRDIRDGSSPTRTASMNSSTVRVKYFCDPDKLDSGDVACFFLGAPAKVYTNALTGTETISRLMPQIWPGTNRVAATQIVGGKGFRFSSTDMSGSFPIAKYTTGEVEVLFETCPFDLSDDAHTSREFYRYTQRLPADGEASFLSLPGSSGLKYAVSGGGEPHGRPVPFNIGLTLTGAIFKRIWHRLDRSVWQEGTTIWNRVWGDYEGGTIPFVGAVNTTSIFGMGPGTLLCLAPGETVYFDPVTDDEVTNLEYRFQFKPQGHNWMPYSNPATTDPIKWALVTKSGTFSVSVALPDYDSLFPARDMKQLWVAAV